MKTGFTNKSKYSLVATAHRGNTHLIAVVLGANDKDVRASTATNMLNRGFNIIGETAPADVAPASVVESHPITQNNPMAKYATDKPKAVVQSGNAGVQFGAFSSYGSADAQVQKVKNAIGVNATISQAPNGLYRVRASGLSESSAQSIKNKAIANGIDCYVFH